MQSNSSNKYTSCRKAIAELGGLSKDTESKKNVGEPARLAMNYIRTEIGLSGPKLKALTSQGSLLSSLTIMTELTDKATNDDIILTSCLKLHQRVDATGGPHYHTVVLLTDDRNLRVKSHANHMPVKSIAMFMELLNF